MSEKVLSDTKELADVDWTKYPVSVGAILWGFENVPIMERLEFAKALVCGNGGEKDSVPVNPALVVAAELIESALVALRQNPKAAKLKTTYEPR